MISNALGHSDVRLPAVRKRLSHGASLDWQQARIQREADPAVSARMLRKTALRGSVSNRAGRVRRGSRRLDYEEVSPTGVVQRAAYQRWGCAYSQRRSGMAASSVGPQRMSGIVMRGDLA